MAVGPTFNTISGTLQQVITGTQTERLLIIGTAVDGPLNQPVPIRNATDVLINFGPANYTSGYVDPNTSTQSGNPNGATLPLAIANALAAGATQIYAVRASGNYATAASAFGNSFDIRSIYPGRIYNGITISLAQFSSGTTVSIAQPSSKGGTIYVNVATGGLVRDLINSINGNPNNQTIVINPQTWGSVLTNLATTLASGSVTLAGGTNGCRAVGDDFGPDNANGVNGLATLLTATDTGTFASLLGTNMKFNVAVLSCIYLDDQIVNGGSATTTSIAIDFMNFINTACLTIGPCHGVMGVRPSGSIDTKAMINYVKTNLLTSTPGFYNSSLRWICAGPVLAQGFFGPNPAGGSNIDLGSRLSIVAGPDAIYNHPDVGAYTEQWHVSYAALLTTLPPENAAIQRQVPGVIRFGTPIPQNYVNQLIAGVGADLTNSISGAGAYVVANRSRFDITGPLQIADDPTASQRADYLNHYQLMHLCNAIHNDMDFQLNGFIGGPTSSAALAAMNTAVKNVLDGYVSSGALKGGQGTGYNFTISQTGNDALLGAINVYVEIAPATALRTIRFTVAIRRVQ